MTSRICRWAAVCTVTGFSTLPGQELTVTASPVAAFPRVWTTSGGVEERVGGVWFGVEAELRAGPVIVSATGMRGNLSPSGLGYVLDQDGGEVSARVDLAATDWLSLGVGYTARAFRSPLVYRRWRMVRTEFQFRRTLGHESVTAHLGLGILPWVTLTGDASPSLSISAQTGIQYAPRRWPFLIGVRYHLERYDFTTAGNPRYDQFDNLTTYVALRVGRRAGRWTLLTP